MRCKDIAAAAVLLAMIALFAGCEPQAPRGDVAYVEDENARLKQLLIQYENDARNVQAVVAESNSRADRARIELDAANRKLAVYDSEVPQLRALATSAATAVRTASYAPPSSRAMSDKVTQQLTALAEQFGGQVVGNRVELPGDFFFDSGKYELNQNAKAAVRRMAEILSGENLFLMVVGYTDNDPIKNPALRNKGINDNLHLSLLRAKAVVDELRKAGYPPNMMFPTGWGEQRPLVANTDKTTKKLNRRVDILIDPAASNIFGMSTITDIEPVPLATR